MNLNGVWKVELLTMYVWEPRATGFFRDGDYWGASSQHYALGSYTVDGTKFVAEVTLIMPANMPGQSRALFGKKADRIDITIEAEAAEDEFTGTAKDKNGTHLVQYRFTKLADWP